MLVLLLCGCVFYLGIFLLSKRALRILIGWSEGDSAVVSTRLVSSLQAVMASSVGYIITSSCSDIIEDSHWLTDAYIVFATPYFLYDIYAMWVCYGHRLRVKGHQEGVAVLHFLRREFLLVTHHIFMVAICCPVSLMWRKGKADYFQGVLFLAELSTPSVSLGKVLIQYQQQHTLLYKLNGLFTLVSFFSCRVFLFPYLYFTYSRYLSVPLWAIPMVVPWQCNLGFLLLWPLQLYWFTLIAQRAVRHLTTRHITTRPVGINQ
ncbi:TLC domain containing 3Ba isoform X2 [Gouania willdenowi]|uniref:Protein FAM57B-like n=1 Tax=Gouania willdenowi TaxID=441366 RepID=A0A8C5E6P7_GOUWI|nr:protein FAM57B-like isoform X2 [Gouania willdenowi]